MITSRSNELNSNVPSKSKRFSYRQLNAYNTNRVLYCDDVASFSKSDLNSVCFCNMSFFHVFILISHESQDRVLEMCIWMVNKSCIFTTCSCISFYYYSNYYDYFFLIFFLYSTIVLHKSAIFQFNYILLYKQFFCLN